MKFFPTRFCEARLTRSFNNYYLYSYKNKAGSLFSTLKKYNKYMRSHIEGFNLHYVSHQIAWHRQRHMSPKEREKNTSTRPILLKSELILSFVNSYCFLLSTGSQVHFQLQRSLQLIQKSNIDQVYRSSRIQAKISSFPLLQVKKRNFQSRSSFASSSIHVYNKYYYIIVFSFVSSI